ncbi:MAG: TPM domain-containing protein [Phycisphaerae bacterium]
MAQPRELPRNTAVIDEVGVVDAKTRAALDAYLLELERKTKSQVRVLIVKTTHGRDVHAFGMEVAQRWQLGGAEEDNGLLVVIAVADRRYAFVTGEGIEDTLPDLYCDTLARKYFVPNFRKNDYASGIYWATLAVARRIAKDAGAQLSGAPPAPARRHRAHRGRRGRGGGAVCGSSAMLIIIVLFFAVLSSRRQRHYRSWGGGGFWAAMLLGSMLGGSRRSGWGGGGFGGGGFGGGGFGGGGCGGGGGGSFGGGGASGGW